MTCVFDSLPGAARRASATADTARRRSATKFSRPQHPARSIAEVPVTSTGLSDVAGGAGFKNFRPIRDALAGAPRAGSLLPALSRIGRGLFDERKLTMVDTCDNCGASLDDGSHFAVGKTWCRECWSGRKPPVAMPCTPRQLDIIRDWIQPRVQATRTPATLGRIIP
jgi:hypothetical protein